MEKQHLIRLVSRICKQVAVRSYMQAVGAPKRAFGSQPPGRHREVVQFLCLHHRHEDSSASLRSFVRQLKEQYQIVSYSRAVELVHRGQIDGPYLAFSFDDGLSSHTQAADVLYDLGVSACFFVCPFVIGNENDSERESFCRDRLKVDPTHFLSWAEIDRMIEQGHEIGSHTFSHHNLARLEHEDGVIEIEQAQRILKDRLGECKHFAWPYGRFATITPQLVRAVFDAGHLTCASTEHGWHGEAVEQSRSLCIRREPIECDWSTSRLVYALTKRLRYRSGQSGWPTDWGSTIQRVARQRE